MDFGALMALGAAVSWALAALVSHRPASELGSVHFNRVRMIAALVIMTALLVITGRPLNIASEMWLPIILSGLIGVVFGDFFLFATMRRLGPRRTNILFATNAIFAALLGWLFLGETISVYTGLTILLGFAGVVLAVVYGKRKDLLHQWEAVMPPLWLGIVLGLMAAICQALGVLIIRPVMAAGADPVATTLARIFVGAVVFWATLPFDAAQRGKPLFPRGWSMVCVWLNGLFGLGVGAAMLLQALETTPVAKVTILSSTTPVLMLPVIWARTRRIPAAGAWAGAILVVLSTGFLVV